MELRRTFIILTLFAAAATSQTRPTAADNSETAAVLSADDRGEAERIFQIVKTEVEQRKEWLEREAPKNRWNNPLAIKQALRDNDQIIIALGDVVLKPQGPFDLEIALRAIRKELTSSHYRIGETLDAKIGGQVIHTLSVSCSKTGDATGECKTPKLSVMMRAYQKIRGLFHLAA